MNNDLVVVDFNRRIAPLTISLLAALALLVTAVGLSQAASTEHGISSAEPKAIIRNLQANDRGVSFTLQTPVIPAQGGVELLLEGLDRRSREPGLPSLPYFTTYVALPPEAQVRLTLSQADPVIQAGVGLPAVKEESVGVLPMFGNDDLIAPLQQMTPANSLPADQEPKVSRPGGFFPERIVDISEPMMFRDVRLVRVSLFPLRYDVQRQLLAVSPELNVSIEFELESPQPARRPAPSHADQHMAAVSQLVINPDQLAEFRSLPAGLTGTGTALPLERDLYKIAVTEDGIYQITYADLAAAGMDVATVDPASIEMLHRGSPVATQFVGDADDKFEPDESVQFYGFDFDGSRLEKQFVSENIFWLWAGGVSRPVASKPSVAGEPISATLANLTREPEVVYFQGYTEKWPENEPDAWYWERFTAFQTPITRTYVITLPHPAESGPPAVFTAEFGSYDGHLSDQTHHITVSMNGHPNKGERTWDGDQNFNVSASIPLSAVLSGANALTVTALTEGSSVRIVTNRITVDYYRQLVAENDQLILSDQAGGRHRFPVRGFGNSDPDEILIWDISNPYSPTVILSSTVTVSGHGPYTVTFGSEHESGATFIVTVNSNVVTPPKISRYVAPQLDPPAGADWVAIVYGPFLTETARLADHRADTAFGGLITHMVNIDDIVNEYGYGLPVPAAVQNYLIHSLATWSVKPSYVTMVGDTTLDPRGIKSDWTDPQYVLTDLVFVDQWNGHIPSDLTFALVSGADILPDLAVGRIAAASESEVAAAIDKIIRYDKNQLLSFGWMQNLLFVADDTDPGAGDFCYENRKLSERLPESLNSIQMCLDDYFTDGSPDGEAFRSDIMSFLADTGATVLNYRGHGSIGYWGGTPIIFRLSDVSNLNNQQPFVAISGDCLDGHYAYPPWEGLGERLISNANFPDEVTGAAAHWGASGLGLSSDHTDILNGFYDGIFSAGQTALGAAVTYAKIAYAQDYWNDPALLYSFNLQGDPAMHLMRPNLRLEGAWQQGFTKPDNQASLSLELQNLGVYPASVTLVSELPPGFAISSVSSTVTSTVRVAGGSAEITLQFGQNPHNAGIPRYGHAAITVTYDVAPGIMLGPVTGHVVAQGGGLDAWPGDETVRDDIYVVRESIWLPALRR